MYSDLHSVSPSPVTQFSAAGSSADLDILLSVEDTGLAESLVKVSLLTESVDFVAAGTALNVTLLVGGSIHQVVDFTYPLRQL